MRKSLLQHAFVLKRFTCPDRYARCVLWEQAVILEDPVPSTQMPLFMVLVQVYTLLYRLDYTIHKAYAAKPS